MSDIKKAKISDLVPDDLNANKGTEFGQHLVEDSLRKFGAGRSILLDKNNRIIAGNKTVENAGAIGLENVLIVETTGNQIVAVKRTDIDLDSQQGREMAIADNASAKANISWDAEVIENIQDEWGVDVEAWGVEVDLGFGMAMPSDDELIAENKNKPATMKITFPTPEDLQKCESEIQEVINRICPKAFYSVSAGEL